MALSKTSSTYSASEDDDFEMVDAPLPSIEVPVLEEEACQDHCNSDANLLGIAELFDPLLTLTQANAAALWKDHGPIFHTKLALPNKNSLYDAFLSGLPSAYRQAMTCSACRRFIRKYGDLCVVGDDGSLIPLLWPLAAEQVPEFWKRSYLNVVELFKNQVVGEELKLNSEGKKAKVLGTPVGGEWTHFSLTCPLSSPAYQAATLAQNTQTSYEMLDRILTDNSAETISQAHHFICDDQLPYATSHKAPISYLQGVVDKLEAASVKDPIKRTNLVTRFAREAFVGCLSSLRSGMLGHLLQCIGEDQDFETIYKNWVEKAGPVTYLRPTALPSAGNIQAAEQTFDKLGYTRDDLRRVFLTLDQVPQSAILWAHADAETKDSASEKTLVAGTDTHTSNSTKLFSSVIPKTPKYINEIPLQDISFRKFVQTVLPAAANVDYEVNVKVSGYFFTTGRPGSKPLMAFHNEGSHTASWYTYCNPRTSLLMDLKTGWSRVKAIVSFPHMWDEFESAADGLDDEKAQKFKFKRHDIRYLFVLQGAHDTTYHAGLGLFPTLLNSDFHGVRSTIEAFSSDGKIEQPDDPSTQQVAGVAVLKEPTTSDSLHPVLRVTTVKGKISHYKIVLFD